MLNGIIVNAYNAQDNRFYPAVLKKESGVYKTVPCPGAQSDIYLTPGWIDMHTHIFDGFGVFGIEAEEIGWRTGCCLLVDAGTVGGYTIKGFRKYLEPTIQTNFRLFLCISPIGVIFHHENNAMEYLNADETLKVIDEHQDIICGVKVRIGSEVIRHEGIEPLRIASDAARRAGLPLMVHIGGLPPTIDDVEPFLHEGDVVTHIFNGRGGDAWDADGKPAPATQRMLDRGVILDVGHGGASFSFDVCERALRHPLPKISIGTDLHIGSRPGYVTDLATTMTKMFGLGMTLEDVIYGVTRLPAEILKLDSWCRMNELQNATLFRIMNREEDYHDCCGVTKRFDKKIVPTGVILKGIFHDLDALMLKRFLG